MHIPMHSLPVALQNAMPPRLQSLHLEHVEKTDKLKKIEKIKGEDAMVVVLWLLGLLLVMIKMRLLLQLGRQRNSK
jgi:hypothetical protein